MSYTDRHLAPGGRIVFCTRLHPIVFGSNAFFAACVIGVVALIEARNELAPGTVATLWLAGVAIALASLLPPFLRWRTSEFAVTDRRVLVKLGLLSLHTLELLLPKVEAIGVDQPLLGRLLVGTGGTVEEFERVARPEALREAVVRLAPASPVARAR